MLIRLVVIGLVLLLAGCATAPPPLTPDLSGLTLEQLFLLRQLYQPPPNPGLESGLACWRDCGRVSLVSHLLASRSLTVGDGRLTSALTL